MQMLGPTAGLLNQESSGKDPTFRLHRSSRRFWRMLKFEKHWFKLCASFLNKTFPIPRQALDVWFFKSRWHILHVQTQKFPPRDSFFSFHGKYWFIGKPHWEYPVKQDHYPPWIETTTSRREERRKEPQPKFTHLVHGPPGGYTLEPTHPSTGEPCW